MVLVYSVYNCNMLFSINLVLSFLLHFVIITYSMKIRDLAFISAGGTHSYLNQDCSYPCQKISNKMVAFDIGLTNL